MKSPTVYMMASQKQGTIYIGVTSNLIQRVWQHRTGAVEGFTQQYGVKMLVWYEQHESMESAIVREKAMKKWRRDWKINLIERDNPDWLDLWSTIVGESNDTHSMSPVVPASLVIPASSRHSREGGNPANGTSSHSHASCHSRAGGNPHATDSIDSRLRGNDGTGVTS